MNSTGIGALVSTKEQISTQAHNYLNATFFVARKAFLALVQLNVWGLATLLSKKAFYVSEEVNAKAGVGNIWWDVQARFRNGWFNLGGKWDNFVNAVQRGKSKRALGFEFAPAGIKAKLKAQGIGSYTALGSFNRGIGEVVTGSAILATVTAASGIYMALKPIIDDLFNKFSKKDANVSEIELQGELNSDNSMFLNNGAGGSSQNNGAGGSSQKAGAGLIGLAALAAIYFGTMSKK